MLHAFARGRAAARRGGHVPQLSRGDLQDVGVAQPGRGEDGVGAAVRVQVLHVRVPAPLAAAPRGEHVRGEVTYTSRLSPLQNITTLRCIITF